MNEDVTEYLYFKTSIVYQLAVRWFSLLFLQDLVKMLSALVVSLAARVPDFSVTLSVLLQAVEYQF